MEPTLHSGVVLATIEDETNGTRFEEFCTELISAEEQKLFFKTSQNYDQQRDGRSLDDAGEYICSGATSDLLAKAKKDISGLVSKTDKVKRVVVCGRENLSEYTLDKVKAELSKEFPKIDKISMNGGLQLTGLAVQHPEIFKKHYQTEYNALMEAKTNPLRPSGDNKLNGLRLAAAIQLHESVQLRRSEIVRNLIVEALEKTGRATVRKLTKYVSDGLRLPTPLEHSWFIFELKRMIDLNLVVTEENEQYTLTEKGRELAGQRHENDGQFILDFQDAFKKAILELTGTAMTDDELRFLWSTLEEGLVSVFVGHGADLIRSVHRLVATKDDEDAAFETEGLRDLLSNLCNRIANLPGKGGRLRDISNALSDMFCDPSTAAFDYLSRVCDTFVHVCSLGLEPNVNDAIIETVKNSTMYLDTDILLSLLSPGEYNHTEVTVLINAWNQKGGVTLAPSAALEEASHHAYIGDNDYRNVESTLHKFESEDSYRYINNVFVRGYWYETNKLRRKFSRASWNQYLSLFRGRTDHDSSKIEALLGDIGVLPAETIGAQDEAVKHLSERLVGRSGAFSGLSPHAIREKCSRDARTALLLTKTSRDNQHRNVVLLSTSRSVRKALQILSKEDSNQPMIWFLPSLAWVLSQCPGVTVTASTLQKVLFNVDVQGKMSPLERTCVRAARISDEHDFHWSRKPALMQAVRDQIRSKAEELAIDQRDIEEKIINATEDDVLSAEILAKALDKISVSKSEREIERLRKKLKE